jgi:predicted DNA binding protein
MGLIAEYHVSYQHLPLVDVASVVPEMTLRLAVGQPNQAGPPPFIVRATGEAFEPLERAFENTEFVQEYSLIDRERVSRQYQLFPAASMEEQLGEAVEQPAKLRSLATNRSIIERITVTHDGWTQKRWFADRDTLTEYCAFWRENGESFSIKCLSESSVNADENPTMRMTDRQREALLTAYEMGYFEIPRTANQTDVATALGISEPSLSERLRRAQIHLMERFLASDEAYKTPNTLENSLPG